MSGVNAQNQMPQLTQNTPKVSGVFFDNTSTQLTHENKTFIEPQPAPLLASRASDKTGFKPSLFTSSCSIRMKDRNEVKKVACSAKKIREVFIPIYDALQIVSLDAIARMSRPVGVMIRFTLTTDGSPAKVMQRIIERFTRASQHPSKPAYVWVREIREHDYEGNACQYDHYHAVLIIDRSSHWLPTLSHSLSALQGRGQIEGWHISRDKQGLKVHDILLADGLQAFEWHYSYIAKVDTKLHCAGRRIFGRSQVSAAAATSFKPVPKRSKVMQVRTEDDKAIEAASRQRRTDYLKRASAMLAERNQTQL